MLSDPFSVFRFEFRDLITINKNHDNVSHGFYIVGESQKIRSSILEKPGHLPASISALKIK
jgi:hypothetical protein